MAGPWFASLRWRIPATAMAVLAITLLLTTGLAYELLLQAGRADVDVVLEREEDRFARSMAGLLPEVTAQAQTEAEAVRLAVRRYLALNPATESYWTIVHFEDGGGPLAASNGPAELEELFFEGTLPRGTPNRRETLSTPAGDIRTSAAPITINGEQVALYQVVAPLAPIRAEALRAAGLIAAASVVALLIGGTLLTVTLRRSLRPLKGLAQAARDAQLESLDQRVEVPQRDDEVGRLAREFNHMLDRLQAASDQQRIFMASVSHELRTPITIARGHLELLTSHAFDGPGTRAETIGILEEELARMGRLVEDLFAIARAEMPDFVRPRPVELPQFFEDLELRLVGLKATDVRVQPPPAVILPLDPDRLAQAVLNLVVNAQVHTPAGTPVVIDAEEEPGGVAIRVRDRGPGIPDEIRDEVFAPFVRAGTAAQSTGLGLSVVDAVVRAHQGRIDLDTGPHGTTVVLHLPEDPLRSLSAPSQPVAAT